ncbi:MAG: MFS transporter [Paludibacteraceae bacterium]|nr:MFS transporter [Paludibacteraceae bacterium]
MLDNGHRSPWLWVPTLYLAEGIPYILVNNISVALMANMGVPNGKMALFTSLLYLPWTIKPFWSPFVDIVKTKRWWIVFTQILLTACFVGLTLSLPHPDSFTIAGGNTPIGLFGLMLVFFWITAFASATHDIAADGYYMLALDDNEQALFVGIRSTFYRIATILGQGGLLYIAGHLARTTQNIPMAWQITLLVATVLFGVLTLWHTRALPHSEKSVAAQRTPSDILREFGLTFVSFFTKKGVWLGILFLLLYRLPEALSLKLIFPFMMSPVEQGGLGLGLDQIGIIYSTIGIICLTVGGILGGWYISRVGLKRALWPMALCMTLPCLAFIYLSMMQPSSVVWITLALAIEQFGYGFGFTAFMMVMIHISEGTYKTAHYAICTAFMALSMLLPGMAAGYLQEQVGYIGFFWLVMICCLPVLLVTFLMRRKLE